MVLSPSTVIAQMLMFLIGVLVLMFTNIGGSRTTKKVGWGVFLFLAAPGAFNLIIMGWFG